MNVSFDIYERLLGFKKELALTAYAERIVWGFGCGTNLDGVFMNYVFICFSKTLLIIYVPSKSFEEGINKFSSDLGFVVVTGFIRR